MRWAMWLMPRVPSVFWFGHFFFKWEIWLVGRIDVCRFSVFPFGRSFFGRKENYSDSPNNDFSEVFWRVKQFCWKDVFCDWLIITGRQKKSRDISIWPWRWRPNETARWWLIVINFSSIYPSRVGWRLSIAAAKCAQNFVNNIMWWPLHTYLISIVRLAHTCHHLPPQRYVLGVSVFNGQYRRRDSDIKFCWNRVPYLTAGRWRRRGEK